MAYIGNSVNNQGFTPAVDYFSGNGSTVTFTLSRPVAAAVQVEAVIDNVVQNPSTAYTVSGNAITFTSAPLSGSNNIYVRYTSLITTYNGISQSPSVIGDLTASGGYLSTGSFNNSFVDGTIVDYVTGNGRITVGSADGFTIYNGGTSARSALASWTQTGALTLPADATINGLTVGKGGGAVSGNTVVGASALATNSTGSGLCAIGSESLYNNTGSYNTAIGYGRVLYANTTGASNVAVGGNDATSNGTMRFNTTGSSNSAFGIGALGNNTTGSANTAVGYQAAYAGSANITAIGYQAAYNEASANSTALGYQALFTSNGGNENLAVGHSALYSNTTGAFNTAVGGRKTLYSNTTGSYNTAVGWNAGYSNTTNGSNTYVGQSAGYYNTGSNNTWIGDSCGALNGGTATGRNNTAIGQTAHYSMTTGSYNVALGCGAGKSITTGNGNLCIAPQDSAGNYNPVNDPSTGSNIIAMGSTGITNAYVKVSWTVTSDARDKTNIVPVTHGLSFVNQLNPVAYQFTDNRTDKNPTGDVRYGFLAQDILALEGNNPVIIDNKDEDHLKYSGESLVPVLVKAIQELNAKVTALEAKLEAK